MKRYFKNIYCQFYVVCDIKMKVYKAYIYFNNVPIIKLKTILVN